MNERDNSRVQMGRKRFSKNADGRVFGIFHGLVSGGVLLLCKRDTRRISKGDGALSTIENSSRQRYFSKGPAARTSERNNHSPSFTKNES